MRWAIAGLLVVGLMLVPLPPHMREVHAIADLAHAPIFGVLAMAIYRGARSRFSLAALPAALLSWGLAVLAGISVERIQTMTGRSANWHDVLADAMGAGGALLLASVPRNPAYAVRAGLLAAGTGLFLVPSVPPVLGLYDAARQRWGMPNLGSFESAAELSRWEFSDSLATRSTRHATDGVRSLELRLGTGPYPGATLAWPVPDWSGYRYFEFDVGLVSRSPLDLVVKIEDQGSSGRYEDRFERVERLGPGLHSIRIPLADVERLPSGRRLDLTRIQRVQFFTVRPPMPRTLFLDNLRLR
jgi:VanZ family protein